MGGMSKGTRLMVHIFMSCNYMDKPNIPKSN